MLLEICALYEHHCQQSTSKESTPTELPPSVVSTAVPSHTTNILSDTINHFSSTTTTRDTNTKRTPDEEREVADRQEAKQD